LISNFEELWSKLFQSGDNRRIAFRAWDFGHFDRFKVHFKLLPTKTVFELGHFVKTNDWILLCIADGAGCSPDPAENTSTYRELSGRTFHDISSTKDLF
jgi:hypothetical protein